jgi:hypothetical protein
VDVPAPSIPAPTAFVPGAQATAIAEPAPVAAETR